MHLPPEFARREPVPVEEAGELVFEPPLRIERQSSSSATAAAATASNSNASESNAEPIKHIIRLYKTSDGSNLVIASAVNVLTMLGYSVELAGNSVYPRMRYGEKIRYKIPGHAPFIGLTQDGIRWILQNLESRYDKSDAHYFEWIRSVLKPHLSEAPWLRTVEEEEEKEGEEEEKEDMECHETLDEEEKDEANDDAASKASDSSQSIPKSKKRKVEKVDQIDLTAFATSHVKNLVHDNIFLSLYRVENLYFVLAYSVAVIAFHGQVSSRPYRDCGIVWIRRAGKESTQKIMAMHKESLLKFLDSIANDGKPHPVDVLTWLRTKVVPMLASTEEVQALIDEEHDNRNKRQRINAPLPSSSLAPTAATAATAAATTARAPVTPSASSAATIVRNPFPDVQTILNSRPNPVPDIKSIAQKAQQLKQETLDRQAVLAGTHPFIRECIAKINEWSEQITTLHVAIDLDVTLPTKNVPAHVVELTASLLRQRGCKVVYRLEGPSANLHFTAKI
jgi:hypothetical protein